MPNLPPTKEDIESQKRELLDSALVRYRKRLARKARVLVWSLQLTRNYNNVEDIAQEVFQNTTLSLLRNPSNLDPSRPILPYIYQALYHHALRLRKKRRKASKIIVSKDFEELEGFGLDEPWTTSKSSEPDQANEAEAEEGEDWKLGRRKTMYEVIKSLSTADQLVLQLDLKNIKGSELAERLSKSLGKPISRSAAYVRLHRAKKTIKNKMPTNRGIVL